jgi:hypothetical protein
MFKEGYVANFYGMGYQIKDILKEEGIKAPKGFFDYENFYEMFKVVDDSQEDFVGIWFANLEEDMFIDNDGDLVKETPNKFYVDREDVTIWG